MLAVAAALLGAMLAVSLVVEPAGEHSSRLLTRGGGSPARTGLGRAFARTVFDPLHFAMERRMLEGIRGLAENHPVSRTRDLVQLSSWAATFVLFVASGTLVLLGSRSWRRLLGFAAAGVAFQIVTLVQPAPVLSALLVLGVAWIIWPVGRGPARRAGRVLEVTS